MELPNAVRQRLAAVETELGKSVTIMKHGDNYYAYESGSIWDKESKKVKSRMKYLGKIDEHGKFIAASRRSSFIEPLIKSLPKRAVNSINLLKEKYSDVHIGRIDADKIYIYVNGQNTDGLIGTINLDGEFEPNPLSSITKVNHDIIDKTDIDILTCLSMNSRMHQSHMSRLVGISERQLHNRITILERKFGIKYTSQIDITKLGYTQYLVLVKFKETKPDLNKLREVLDNSAKIQFAALLKGEYDLIIFLADRDPVQTDLNLLEFRANSVFTKCIATWYVVPFGVIYSFIPLREPFFNEILKELEWHKTNGKNVDDKNKILMKREFAVLKELNADSTKSFSSIELQYGLGKGSARYAYEELKKKEILLRPTIKIKSPRLYNGIIIRESINAAKLLESIQGIDQDMKEYLEITNKYTLIGNVGAPTGMVYFISISNEEELEKARAHLDKVSKGGLFKSILITDILVGSLCYRRFDNTYFDHFNRYLASDRHSEIRRKNYGTDLNLR